MSIFLLPRDDNSEVLSSFSDLFCDSLLIAQFELSSSLAIEGLSFVLISFILFMEFFLKFSFSFSFSFCVFSSLGISLLSFEVWDNFLFTSSVLFLGCFFSGIVLQINLLLRI